MAVTTTQKAQLVKDYQRAQGDTGSPEVQIALLTQRITELTEHLYAQDFDRDSNVIEVHVNHVRNKIGTALIKTRRGQGYVFGAPR